MKNFNNSKKVKQISQHEFKHIKSLVINGDMSGTHGDYIEGKVKMSSMVVFSNGEFLEKKRSKGNSMYFVTEGLQESYKELSNIDYPQTAIFFS